MKKILLIITASLMMAGCAKATAEYKPEDTASLIEIGDYAVTKKDLYNAMYAGSAAKTAYNFAINEIVDKEVEITEEMKTSAKETLDIYKQIYGDNFQNILDAEGMTEDEYAEKILTTGSRQRELRKRYATDHFDELYKELNPVYAVILPVNDEETAKGVSDGLKSGTSVSELIANYSISASETPEIFLNSNTNYSKGTVKAIVAEDTLGKWIQIGDGKSSPAYYIVKSEKADKDLNKDDLINAFADDESVKKKADAYYFKKYKFAIHDEELKKLFSESYPEIK